jgi:tripartite-type tricarboxylate transporter receptor subunit TctC
MFRFIWLVLLFVSCPAFAWKPDGQVTIVLPFQIHGNAGQAAVIVKTELAKRGVNSAIMHKPGAAGAIGHKFLAESPADGLTIGFVTTSSMEVGDSDPAAGYSRRSFAIASVVGDQSFMLASNSSAFASLNQFLRHSGGSRFGFINSGHESGFLAIVKAAGRSMDNVVRVNYKAGNQLFIDLASGDIHLTFSPTANLIPFANSGRVRLLAVSTEKRLSKYPEIPVIAEALPSFSFESHLAIALPANAPKNVVDFYSRALREITSKPDVVDFFYGSPLHMARVSNYK